jgi:glycosyltransferase involved in cell wall biosynthesis
MKILQINTTYRTGGSTGKIMFELAQIIKEHNEQSYCAFGYEFKPTNDENTYKIESILQLKFSILQTRLFGEHGFYNQGTTKKLLKWIDEVKPDVIHLHNLHNHYLNLELLFRYIKDRKIPVVWTLHDCWSFTGWCAYFDYARCDQWKSGCHHCPCLKDYPKTWFFDRSEKNYKRKKELLTGIEKMHLVTPSQWLADLTRESFLKGYPVSVINNGIDLKIFSAQNDEVNIDKYIPSDEKRKVLLGVASSWSRRKGLNDFLKLNEQINHDKYVIVLVGLKQEQLKAIPDTIRKVLRTENVNELAELYRKADVFLNLTWEDNYPTTNLEAQACGTPVISYQTGGSSESIVSGVTGEIVPAGNMAQLMAQIDKVCGNREAYSLAAERHAHSNFDKHSLFEKYIDIYRRLLEA